MSLSKHIDALEHMASIRDCEARIDPALNNGQFWNRDTAAIRAGIWALRATVREQSLADTELRPNIEDRLRAAYQRRGIQLEPYLAGPRNDRFERVESHSLDDAVEIAIEVGSVAVPSPEHSDERAGAQRHDLFLRVLVPETAEDEQRMRGLDS